MAAAATTIIVLAAGAGAGVLGALLGIGGGIVLVPFLNLVLHFPISESAAISLVTVIATSSTVTASRSGAHLVNLRLGMVLEVATAAGSLLGGITAQTLAPATIQRLFAIVAIIVSVLMTLRLNVRNVLSADADPGALGGRYHEDESGGVVSYRVKRLPVALAASFVAGNVSSLLGVGGGVIKVPALNAWCGVPLRAAAATSAFMIGVTATAGAVIYFGHGLLPIVPAAAAVLGVQVGSRIALTFSARVSAKWLKALMAGVLFVVAILMFLRAGL
ncbi:MAG TPA: sulfite exporter TauE/SafE family protein [Vicinamibacterales bacterium]|jgi:hypothetical protein|nr:sulfite exporter TauE/SafE family protein [Vicinamibacterales bacterium]